ncbi:cytochrome d oxidase cyd subunit II [Mycobacteroides abscessus subsp. abscessus]|nr:cytochrome d oxidase cyd subunit II [Mycobacteroides abscessus subsp. abscessus]
MLEEDSKKYAKVLAIPTLVVAAVFLLWTQFAYGNGWTWIPVLIAAVAAVVMVIATQAEREGIAFTANAIAIAGTVASLFACLFPNVLPSTTDSAFNLTVENTASSDYTLTVMTIAAVVVTPIVIAYQAWTYWVFRKRLSVDQIPESIGLSSLKAWE